MAFDAKAAADRQRQNQQNQQAQQDSEAQLEAERRRELQEAVEDRAGELVVAIEDRVNRLENLGPDEYVLEAEQLSGDLQVALVELGFTHDVKKKSSGKPKGGFLARALAKAKELDDRSQLGRKPEVK